MDMTKDNPVAAGVAIDLIAETIWRSEWRRAGNGGERRVPWSEIAEKDQERYRFLARDVAALFAASPVQAGIDPLVARLGRIASERHTISHDEYGAKKALGVMAGMSDALDEAAALLRSQAERIAALEVAASDAWTMFENNAAAAHSAVGKCLNLEEALAAAESLLAEAREALTAIYEWWDRDGSVGGASLVFDENRATLSRLKPGEKGGGE